MDANQILFAHQQSLSKARVNHRLDEPSELVYRCLDDKSFTDQFDRPGGRSIIVPSSKKWNGNPMR